MNKTFITQSERKEEILDWGILLRLSGPEKTNATQLVVIEVNIKPGMGHNFHKHPLQEEVIYVIEGKIEQWVGEEKRYLSAGESVFIPADKVHASFNAGTTDAKLLAILSPCVGDAGYDLVEVYDQSPWKELR